MIKRIGITFLARISNIAGNLLVAVLISNQLGAAGRGEQSLILLSITLVALVTNITAGSSVSILSKAFHGAQLLKVSYVFIALTSALSGLTLHFLGLLNIHVFHLIFISIIFGFWTSHANYLLGREKTDWFNILNILQTAVLIGTLAVSYFLGSLNLSIYILGLYLSHFLTLLLSIYPIRLNLQEGKKQLKHIALKFLKHGGFIQLANLAQLLNYRFSFYLIEFRMGTDSVGYFANAIAVCEGVWLITRSISLIIFSKVINLENHEESINLTWKYTIRSVYYTAPSLMLLLILPDSLFILLFGPQFSGISDLFIWFAPGVLALSAGNVVAHYFSGRGMNELNFYGSLAGLLVTIGLGMILIPWLGLKGAAITSSAAFVVVTAFYMLLFRSKYFKLKKDLMEKAALQK